MNYPDANNKEHLYKFLKERNYTPINIDHSVSEEIHKVFVFLDSRIKQILINRLGLEKAPDICLFSKAKFFKYDQDLIISCPTSSENFRLYSFENNKLKILKYCIKEKDGSLGECKGIKKKTKQKNFSISIVKDGRKKYYPMSKGVNQRNNNNP